MSKKIIKIAMVDDEKEFHEELADQLRTYAINHSLNFQISHFYSGEEFLKSYNKGRYNIIFMDVQMTGENGLETARKLRLIDAECILIFLTNLAQYAIKGYEVDALDFVVKPITFSVLSMKLQRALQRLNDSHSNFKLTFSFHDNKYFVDINEVKYFEIKGHKLSIHTAKETYQTYDMSLTELENTFKQQNIGFFARCNNYLLVNLNYVTSLLKNELILGDEKLPISRSKKNQLIERLSNFFSQGNYNV